MKEELKQSSILWNTNTFSKLKDGESWAVPRSGMIFKRIGDHLELLNVMPFTGWMGLAAQGGMDVPGTAEELLEYQREDFACIQRSFIAAGIDVTDPRELLIDKHITAEQLQEQINKETLQEIADTFPA